MRIVGIIIKKAKILLIHRKKDRREYYVFPGGSIEENETEKMALKREIKEELNLSISRYKKLFEIDNRGRREIYYLIKEFSGNLQIGSPEKERMSGRNQYLLEWIDLKKITGIENLLPHEAVINIFKFIKSKGKSLKINQYNSSHLKDTYNKIAEDWHKTHRNDDWWVEGTDKFLSFLKKNDFVLDIGCGGGTKSNYLIKKGMRVLGIDFSRKMISICRREVLNGEFKVMDIENIKGLDRTFDGIFLQAVLLHLPKRKIKGVLKAVASKLKRGGYAYVAVKEIRPNQADELTLIDKDYGFPCQIFYSYYTLNEIKSHLTGCGLKIVYTDIKKSGSTKWLQLIGKK